MTKKQLFNYYTLIGFLYVVIKVIFVSLGFLRPQAIFHGLIPGLLTTGAGLVCKQYVNGKTKNSYCKWIMLLLPVLVFVTTPPYMFWQKGGAWLDNGRLPVLIIYEVLALTQILIALKINKLDEGKK